MKKLIYILTFLTGWNTTASAGTFIEEHAILCGAVIELGPVGYPSWISATLLKAPSHGQVFILTDGTYPDSLVFKSDYGYLGQDTFIVECAHATQISCDTGIYIISIIGCPPIQTFTESYEITCDSTLLIPGLGYPTWVTPEIVDLPENGTASLSLDSALWHSLQYVPALGFMGTDTIVVECAHATQVSCETGVYVIHVSCLNGTGEITESGQLSIFPNPTDGFLTIESSLGIERAAVYSLQGKLLLEERWRPAALKVGLAIEDIPAGVYLLKTGEVGRSVVRKIVVR